MTEKRFIAMLRVEEQVCGFVSQVEEAMQSFEEAVWDTRDVPAIAELLDIAKDTHKRADRMLWKLSEDDNFRDMDDVRDAWTTPTDRTLRRVCYDADTLLANYISEMLEDDDEPLYD